MRVQQSALYIWLSGHKRVPFVGGGGFGAFDRHSSLRVRADVFPFILGETLCTIWTGTLKHSLRITTVLIYVQIRESGSKFVFSIFFFRIFLYGVYFFYFSQLFSIFQEDSDFFFLIVCSFSLNIS